MTDGLTATLAAIRGRAAYLEPYYQNPHFMLDAVVQDAPALLAAIEAVLKLHQPGPVAILGILCKRHENHRFFSITSTEAEDVRACPNCAATVYTSCTGCGPQVSADACPVREAVTAALAGTGKEGSDE